MLDKASFHFSLTFPGQIWKSVIESRQGSLILELREKGSQDLGYASLDVATGQWEHFSILESSWWTSIYRLHYPVLLLEKYDDPQDPAKKSLIVYDLQRHQLVRVLDQFQLVTIQENKLLGHLPGDPHAKVTFDLKGVSLVLDNLPEKELHFPAHYAPDSDSFRTVFEFLELEPPEVGCEYLEWEEYIIISYYIRLVRNFERKLLVLKGDREIYHQIQDEDLSGFASEAFFIMDRFLIFIEKGNQVNAISV